VDLSLGALILFAPTLLVGTAYGMNSNHMPQLHWLLGYPLALLVMLVSSVSLLAKEAPSFPYQMRDRAAPSH
jgi:Mg2+ and Co2+ transporter CorA